MAKAKTAHTRRKSGVTRKKTREGSEKTRIKFHFIKPATCPTYRIDGVFGGPTASGDIFFHAYIDRAPLPTEIEVELEDDGGQRKLGKQVAKKQRDGLIRDVQFGASLSPAAARALAEWLLKKAEIVDNLAGGSQSGDGK